MNHFKINHSNKVYTHKAVCRLLPIFRQHTHPSQTVCVDTYIYTMTNSQCTHDHKNTNENGQGNDKRVGPWFGISWVEFRKSA